MTPEERADAIVSESHELRPLILQAIREAEERGAAAEREACARLMEKMAAQRAEELTRIRIENDLEAAATIRARKARLE